MWTFICIVIIINVICYFIEDQHEVYKEKEVNGQELRFTVGIEKQDCKDFCIHADLHWYYCTFSFCLWALYFDIGWHNNYRLFGRDKKKEDLI